MDLKHDKLTVQIIQATCVSVTAAYTSKSVRSTMVEHVEMVIEVEVEVVQKVEIGCNQCWW